MLASSAATAPPFAGPYEKATSPRIPETDRLYVRLSY
jgi:hypothetical protein